MVHVVDPTIRELHAKVYEALREYWLLSGQGPSKDDIMRAVKCSMTTIIQAARELRNRGYIHAPKHAIKSMKPTDMDRTISKYPPDPWAELEEPTTKFWRTE